MASPLLQKIRAWFGSPGPAAPTLTAADTQVAAYWNAWQTSRADTPPAWHDWSEHPTILACIYQQLFGNAQRNVYDYLRQQYPEFAHSHALSLCCGDGRFEKLLIELQVFARVTGIDLASARVNTANQTDASFDGKLDFIVGDVNAGAFGEQCYGAVFAKAALHHVENLEALFTGIKRCLQPGGKLVTIDFFGPSRFQWTDAQLLHANKLLLELPAELRLRADGSTKDHVERPSVAMMIATDPSEAVRSAELPDFIRAHFNMVTTFNVGGTLLHLVFTPDILNNFNPDDAAHADLIRSAFMYERQLLDSGQLEADFRFIVAC